MQLGILPGHIYSNASGTVPGVSSEEEPKYDSEVGLCGILVAASHDHQGLVLDHLKFVLLGGGHFDEPDGVA